MLFVQVRKIFMNLSQNKIIFNNKLIRFLKPSSFYVAHTHIHKIKFLKTKMCNDNSDNFGMKDFLNQPVSTENIKLAKAFFLS